MRYFALGIVLTACAASPAPKPGEAEIPAPPPASVSPAATASAPPEPPAADAALPSSEPAPPRGRDVGQSCGGIAGLMCKAGLRCVGNPMMCDPHRGGRDCGGVCRPPPPDAGAH